MSAGRFPSLPILGGILFVTGRSLSSFMERHLSVAGGCLSGRVVKRQTHSFVFIEMIKDHLSLVLNDTQSEPIQYLIFCQRMIYSIFDSILFYPRFNSKDYSIKSKTLEKKNSGDSIQ